MINIGAGIYTGGISDSEVDIAYIAGLFDGEGSIHFKRGIEKKKKHKGKPGYRTSNSMRISMEITMTDQSVLIWVHEVLGVGTLRPKRVKGLRKMVHLILNNTNGDAHLEMPIRFVYCFGRLHMLN
jgi:hypothetical protein